LHNEKPFGEHADGLFVPWNRGDRTLNRSFNPATINGVERFSGGAPAVIFLGYMGHHWLRAKRLVTGLKKSKTNTKLVREITIAAKMGNADPG
jgi:hypothetical protein